LAFCALVTSLVLAHVVDWSESDSLVDGLRIGLWVWLGFVATVLAVNTYFSGRPRTLWAIDAGYQLLSLLAMGAILAVWS
jgi:hypothetical protein